MPEPNSDEPQPRTGFEAEALIHLDAVYRFAQSLAQDETAAEDLAQDTFLQALESWHLY